MIQQTEGIIFLADKRHHFQTDNFRSLATLPNAELGTVLAEKFGSLVKFSDNTLAPQKSCTILADAAYCVVLIPLVGAFEIDGRIVDTEEISYLFVKENEQIVVQNPYESELINFIEIWFKSSENHIQGRFFDKFDLSANQNSLNLLTIEGLKISIFIGKFDGRVEDEIDLKDKGGKAFAINLSGSIEVQERLLFERDAVMIWDCNEVGFESLAYESILLLITE
jgi:quercetin 2,3-dioxygenase